MPVERQELDTLRTEVTGKVTKTHERLNELDKQFSKQEVRMEVLEGLARENKDKLETVKSDIATVSQGLQRATGDFEDMVELLKAEREKREAAAAAAQAEAEAKAKQEKEDELAHKKLWREFTEPANLVKTFTFVLTVAALLYAFASGNQSAEDIAKAARELAREEAARVVQPLPLEGAEPTE